MLKRSITYEDFNGDKVTETFYFNLTSSELIELDSGYEGGVGRVFERIVEAKDQESVVKEFKKFILASYGQKSDDGKRFVKRDENDKPLSRHFEETAAYDALFMQLATDANAGAEFITEVIPKEFRTEMDKITATELPSPPPQHQGRVTVPGESPKE